MLKDFTKSILDVFFMTVFEGEEEGVSTAVLFGLSLAWSGGH